MVAIGVVPTIILLSGHLACLPFTVRRSRRLVAVAAADRHYSRRAASSRLSILDGTDRIEWEMPWKAIHDIHALDNGHILVQQGPAASRSRI